MNSKGLNPNADEWYPVGHTKRSCNITINTYCNYCGNSINISKYRQYIKCEECENIVNIDSLLTREHIMLLKGEEPGLPGETYSDPHIAGIYAAMIAKNAATAARQAHDKAKWAPKIARRTLHSAKCNLEKWRNLLPGTLTDEDVRNSSPGVSYWGNIMLDDDGVIYQIHSKDW
tara:strand:+ start:314 stop:835 length:522 start_codon:yes stop_codon:yes gene_type:complete